MSENVESQEVAGQSQAIVHTPGPWMIRHKVNVYARRTDVGHEGSICTAGTHCCNHVDCDPENQANARLIAAAPDLAEALRILYDFQNGPPLEKYRQQWNEGMRLAKAALDAAGKL